LTLLLLAAYGCASRRNPNMLRNNEGDSVRVSPEPIRHASGIPIYGVHEYTPRGVVTHIIVLNCAQLQAGPVPETIDSLGVWLIRRSCRY
jgi:hypothetical protein